MPFCHCLTVTFVTLLLFSLLLLLFYSISFHGSQVYIEYRASLAFDLVSSRQKNVSDAPPPLVSMLSHRPKAFNPALLRRCSDLLCACVCVCAQACTDYSDSVARRMGFIPLPVAVLVRASELRLRPTAKYHSGVSHGRAAFHSG